MNYMELDINGKVYQFNFGIGWMREINKTVKDKVPGYNSVTQDVGMFYHIAQIIDGSPISLIDCLYQANSGFSPRITKKELEAYYEDESTDVDELKDKVIDFLSVANVTKTVTQKILKAMNQEMEEQ